MRTLILTCNTGGGHNACASAMKEVFEARGDECFVTEALGLVSEEYSKFIADWHVRIYRYLPGFFRVGYRYSENHPALFDERSLNYRTFAKGADKLYDIIKEKNVDTVVCAHVFAGLMLTEVMKRYAPAIVTSFLATDYTCSPGGKDIHADRYFIPDEFCLEEFAEKGVPREKIAVTGIPVRAMFRESLPKVEAKAHCGVGEDKKHLVVMSGSMGAGNAPMERLAKDLDRSLDADTFITVVCGTNKKMEAALAKTFADNPRFSVKGFVKDVSTLLDSADLYLSKPGGISTAEAAVKGLPMAFIDAVAGCEIYNLEYFVSTGAAVADKDPAVLSEKCAALLADPENLSRMSRASKGHARPDAAERIREILFALHEKKEAGS